MSSIVQMPLATLVNIQPQESLVSRYLGGTEALLRLAYAGPTEADTRREWVLRKLNEKNFLGAALRATIWEAAQTLISTPIEPQIEHLTSDTEREVADISWLCRFEQKLKRLRMPRVAEERLQALAQSLVSTNEQNNPDLATANKKRRQFRKDLDGMSGGKSRSGRKSSPRRNRPPALGFSHA